MAHFWWGGQLRPANLPGARVLTESLSEYTAIRYLEKSQGQARYGTYLETLSRQASYSKENTPLIHALSDKYLLYKKGALAFNRLSMVMGEDVLNKYLHDFIEHKFDTLTSIEELMEYIETEANDTAISALVDELFYE